MCCALVDAGVWTKLDLFYLFAQESNGAGEALINWVSPGLFDATAFNAPAFTSLEGLTGDGISAFANTNWKPSPDGVNHGLNTASYGLYQRNNAQDSSYSCGVDSGANESWMRVRYTTDSVYGRLNSASATVVANADSRGLFIVNRPDASNIEIHRNKTQLATQARAVSGLPIGDFNIFKRNPTASYVASQFSMFFAGGSFTTADRDNIVDAFEAYMDSNGKGVIP